MEVQLYEYRRRSFLSRGRSEISIGISLDWSYFEMSSIQCFEGFSVAGGT